MKYSLWSGSKYVQSSDSLTVLKCNSNQLKAWCYSMNIEKIDGHLTIKDNDTQDTRVVFQAQYKYGGAVKWREVTYARESWNSSDENTPRFTRAPKPVLAKVYTV